MRRDNLSVEQKVVFDGLSKELQTAYLVAADADNTYASTRILAADMLPLDVLATIDNGVCRAVLKIKRRERGIS